MRFDESSSNEVELTGRFDDSVPRGDKTWRNFVFSRVVFRRVDDALRVASRCIVSPLTFDVSLRRSSYNEEALVILLGAVLVGVRTVEFTSADSSLPVSSVDDVASPSEEFSPPFDGCSTLSIEGGVNDL